MDFDAEMEAHQREEARKALAQAAVMAAAPAGTRVDIAREHSAGVVRVVCSEGVNLGDRIG